MIVTDLKELIPVIQDKEVDEIGLDIETSGLNPFQDRILLVQIATNKDVYTINVGNILDDASERMFRYLLELIRDRDIVVIGHNIKFDMKFIYHNYGVLFTHIFDTMLAEMLSYAGVGSIYVSLQSLAKKYLHIDIDKDIRETFYNKIDYEFTDEQIKYAENDAKLLMKLKPMLQKILQDRHQYSTWKLEMELEPVVTMMEYTGILLDKEQWKGAANQAKLDADNANTDLMILLEKNFDKFAGKYKNALDVLTNIHYPTKAPHLYKEDRIRLSNVVTKDEIKSEVIPRINFGSYVQAKYVLNKLGVPLQTTNAKEMVVYEGSHEVIQYLLKYRHAVKKVTSFGDDFLKHIDINTNAIHTNFNQLGTATGRFSSDDPNLQNIIADALYRSPFVARPGYLLATCDYSEIELRIIGEASKEPRFIEAFKTGKDLHKTTASLILQVPYDTVTKDQRKIGKHLNYAVVYGTSAKGMSYNFRIPEDQCREYLARFFEQFNVLKFFIDKFGTACLEKNYSVTLGGRKRFLSFMLNPRSQGQYKELAKARRQAVNHLPQGTSADMIKRALIYLFYNNPFEYDDFRPLLTVHDEIVIEFKEDIRDEAEVFIHKCFKQAGEDYLKIIPEAHEVIIDRCWRK